MQTSHLTDVLKFCLEVVVGVLVALLAWNGVQFNDELKSLTAITNANVGNVIAISRDVAALAEATRRQDARLEAYMEKMERRLEKWR
jgi:hypothetical protein